MKPVIDLSKFCKSFITGDVETRAVYELDLQIHKGEYLSLSGPSGCGKSTLLSLLGLLDTPTSGTYLLNGKNVSSLDKNQRADIRNQEIGFVFQSFNLISELTVAENVMLPLTYNKSLNRAEMAQRVQKVLEKVDVAHRAGHYPSQLSGGQQQRVAVSRALVTEPSFILADEPTGNLDSKNADIVMELFDQLHGEGTTICMVTHDPRSSERASRQIMMLDGKIATVKGSAADLAS